MVVVLLDKSRRKISLLLLVSPGTRLLASDVNTTNRPLSETEGEKELPVAPVPVAETETRVVVLVDKSRTKMSLLLLVSPGTRLVASDVNTTNRSSGAKEAEKGLPVDRSADPETEVR